MEFHWCVLVIILASMYKAAGQKNLTTEGTAYQSSTYNRFGPHLALSPPASTTWSTSPDTCSHTGQGHLTAWWKILFQQLVFITKIVLYYRDSNPSRVKGFSLYITNNTGTNTLRDLSNSYLCYKDSDTSTNPQFVFDIDCLTVGRNVVFYNTRTAGEAFVELCYVEVHGCPVRFHGINCTNECDSNCLNQLCFPGNGTCVLGCSSEFCIQSKCEGDGTCTEGCSSGQYGQYCNLDHRNLALKRSAYHGPSITPTKSIVDGSRSPESCTGLTESNSWFEVDLGEYSVIKNVYLNFIDTSTNEKGNFYVYCSNVSNSNGIVIYNGQKPTNDLDVPETVCRYVRFLPPDNKIKVCEIELIGCHSGWYGKYCHIPCPEHCGGPCDLETGNCIHGCTDGYTETRCDQECKNGQYGSQCLRNCSHNCNFPCNRVTGSCVDVGCKSGWIGYNCTTECSPGKYGINCLEYCSGCVDELCDNVDGVCNNKTACKPGWKVDPKCNEACGHGAYGFNCEENCTTCMNNTCDTDSGKCVYGCIEGFYGDLCSSQGEEANDISGVIGGGVSAALTMFIAAGLVFLFLRRRNRQKGVESRQKQSDKTSDNSSDRTYYTDLQRRNAESQDAGYINTCTNEHQYDGLCSQSSLGIIQTKTYKDVTKQNETNVYEVASDSNRNSEKFIYQNEV